MVDLPKVRFTWEINAEGESPAPLDQWTLEEVEALLDRNHPEHEDALNALQDDVPVPREGDSSISVEISREAVVAYVEARRAAGLTDRIRPEVYPNA